jgi:two-component system, sensor histidine kinase
MVDETGQPERFVSISYDITERILADAKLKAAMAQAANFFDVAHDAIVVANANGQFMKVNPAFQRVLGYSASELENRKFFDFIHPDDHAATRDAMAKLGAGSAIDNLINRYQRSDGTWRHMEWRGTAIGGLAYASARDITNQLEHEQELEAARASAERATQSKSQFLANMSHEIRTPLNGVIGIAGAMAQLEMPNDQREMVELIQTSGQTLERLLNDILDISKIEAGKLDLETIEFDLKEEVEAAAHLMRIKADEKGIVFNVTHHLGASGHFMGDAIRLRQIVGNLCSNAIKFTDTGSVNLDVEVLNATSQTEPADLKITVRDTGIGFDQSVADRLFSRFEQADGTITREFGGTGLGLSICKSLVEMMGGEISAHSKPGEGSQFTVLLRMTRAKITNQSTMATQLVSLEASKSPKERFAGLKVLVAEDFAINQKVIMMILASCDVRLTFAANGREAVEAIGVETFDAILMDMQMPEMDGLTAIAHIREREMRLELSHAPIAVLSANALSEHLAASLDAGADTHIAKPVTPDALYAGLAQLLEKARPQLNALRAVC